MTEDDFIAKTEEYGDEFRAMMGAEGVRELLRTIDINHDIENLRRELEATGSEAKIKKIAKRLKVLEASSARASSPTGWSWKCCRCCRPSCVRWCRSTAGASPPPTSMICTGASSTATTASSPARAEGARDHRAHEKRMLQESVESLLDNGRRGKAMTGANKRALKSLADMIKGKADASARTCSASASTTRAARHRGRPAVEAAPVRAAQADGARTVQAVHLQQLETMGVATTIKQAKKYVESQEPIVWDILEG